MFDNARMLDLIEQAMDTDRYCPVCHAPMDIRDDAGRLWLECSATAAPDGLLARLSAALLRHPRRLVVDLTEDIAA